MGCSGSKSYQSNGPSVLSDKELLARMESSKTVHNMSINGLEFKYAYLSQRGYYPEALDKPNQDAFTALPKLPDNSGDHVFFAVYDGHGRDGHLCARFSRDHVLNIIFFPPQIN